LDSLTAQNFKWDTTGLSKTVLNTNDRYVFLLDGDGLKAKHEGRGDDLLNASNIALKYLSNKDANFFCMIEGSQIDWGGHNNDANYVAQEVLDFDKVIGAALDFAAKDGNTLVIVTADHETGGYTLSGDVRKGPANKTYNDYNKISPTFSTGGHSASLVPVFAFGPGSENFRGIYENTEIHYKMITLIKGK
jgi:alkaline phosphatase